MSQTEILRASQTHFDIIEKITNTGSFVWDLSLEQLDCSENFLELVEIPNHKDDLKLDKEGFFEIINKDQQSFVFEVMNECIVKREPFEITFESTLKSLKRFRLLGYPLGEYNSTFFFGVIQDITGIIESSHALIRGQDTERKRISLDIHDSVGQKLIAAKYKLASARINRNLDALDELNDALNEIIEEIRGITHNLSSQIVTEVGLRNALGQLLSETAHNLGAEKIYDFGLKNDQKEDLKLGDDLSKMIYRIVQEALANATKHSKATRIEVSLKIVNQQIVVKIIDNGVGMDLKRIASQGIGLSNIKERVMLLSGFVTIDSAPQQGVKIVIKIPFKI